MKMILKILKTYVKEVFCIPKIKINIKFIKAIALMIFFIGMAIVPPMLACVVLCILLNNALLIFILTLIIAFMSCRSTIRTIDKLQDDIFD